MNESERDKDLGIKMKIPRGGLLRRTTFWPCTLRTAVLDHEVQVLTLGGNRYGFHRRETVYVMGKDINFGGGHF